MAENIRIQDLPSDQQPREKMATLGAGALSNEELLAIFLRTGTKGQSAIEIGRQLLQKHNGLISLARLDIQELCKEHGLGLAKACQLKAAFELGIRAARDGATVTKLNNSKAIYDFLSPQLAHLPTEKLYVLTIHSNGNLLKMREISSGNANQTLAPIPDILRPVILDQTLNFIIAHNHPSGDPTPSQADLRLTRELQKSAQQMGLTLLDHLIIGRPTNGTTGYYSFNEEGHL